MMFLSIFLGQSYEIKLKMGNGQLVDGTKYLRVSVYDVTSCVDQQRDAMTKSMRFSAF